MKKLFQKSLSFFLVTIMVLLPFEAAFALKRGASAYQMVASGTVSQANMKISAVDGGATASGGAFFDSSDVDFSSYAGKYIEWKDSAGRIAGAYAKAAGTGETLDTEQIDTWTNYVTVPYDIFTLSGSDITRAQKTTGTAICYKQVTGAGNLFKFVISSYTKASGQTATLVLGRPNTSSGTADLTLTGAATAGTWYVTQKNGTYYELLNTSAADWAASGISLKQVLTPSVTGALLVSTKQGATRTWTYKSPTFNPNDAAGQTWKVLYIGD